MDSDHKVFLIALAIIASAIVSVASICNYQQNLHYLDMVKAGYEQTTTLGHAGLVWQKVKQP